MNRLYHLTKSRSGLFLIRLFCLLLLILFFAWGSSRANEYHVAKTGSDENPGTASKPFLTISKAAGIAKAGDFITVHAGTYRELIQPKNGGRPGSPITYQAARGEAVIIKGSESIKGWQKSAALWQVSIPNTFFKGYNPYKDLVFGDWFFPGRNKVHTGEVYLDNRPLGEVAKVEKPFTWSTESKGDSILLTANFGEKNPNTSITEINVRPACFYPAQTGINYITIKGFHMSQAATQWAAPTAEQTGLIGTNWSKGWVIEDNIISDSKCVGVALGKDRASGHNVWFENRNIDGAVHYNNVVQKVLAEGWSKNTIGSHTVKNNTIFRCGQAGVVGSFGAAFSEISGNHIYDIYTYRNFWGAEMAGIKLHAGIDALIKNNRIHNTQKGIWLDWMTQGTRISSNVLYDNDFVDIFLEVNHGPYLVDNNFFLSGFNLKDLSEGGAFVHNLFAGLISRAPDSRTTPYFKPNGTAYLGLKDIQGGDDRFFNNIFVGKQGRSYYSAVYPAQIPDEIDSLAGYGLAIYNQARYPLSASGNLYLQGAYPLAKEKNARLAYDQSFSLKLDTTSSQVRLRIQSSYLSKPGILPIVTSTSLGRNVNGHSYTKPNGTALSLNQDYNGTTRNPSGNFPGPLKWTGNQTLILWPVPKPKDKK